MNILYHIHRYPLPSFITNEIFQLEQNGHTVAVFVLNPGSGFVKHEETDRLNAEFHFADPTTVRRLPELLSSDVLSVEVLKQLPLDIHPKYQVRFIHQVVQCIQFVDSLDMDVDVIHGHFPTKAKLSAVATAKHFGAACSVAAHDLSDLFTGDNPWVDRVCNSVDRVQAISEYSKSILEDIGVHTPIDIVHMGVRLEKFNPTELGCDHRLLTVARLAEKKGLVHAVDAVAEIVDDFPNVEYHIIGEGDEEKRLRNRIEEHDLDDTVRLLGFVSDERLIDELDRASVFLMPSIVADDGSRDGIPVALMEAMAMQTPPVTTTVSGIPELVDDVSNGLLVNPGSPEALSKGIRRLLDDPRLREQLGYAARETVANEFNSETETRRLVESFRKAGHPHSSSMPQRHK